MTDNLYRYDYTSSATRTHRHRPVHGDPQEASMIWPGYAKANQKRDKAKTEWNEATAPEIDGSMSEVTMLSHFMGSNAGRFLKHKKGLGKPPLFSFNIAAFAFPVAWMFYRKMFGYGVLILLLPLVLLTVFPDLDKFSSISLGAALGAIADSFYLWVATARVKKLKAQAEAEAMSQNELMELLQRSGGTSKIGAAFGLAIILSLLAIPFILEASTNIAG